MPCLGPPTGSTGSMAALASAAVPRGLSWGARGRIQDEILKHLVAKHLKEEFITQFEAAGDYSKTSTERGVGRWEHPHLVAALDVVNTYQRDRRARSSAHIPYIDWRINMRRQFKDDPRTRFIELMKRWLRTNASVTVVEEDEVRRFCMLCRDLLNHSGCFPARNQRSFMRTIAEVYRALQYQLREVLEHDRSCAEIASRALSLGRNLLSDAICYLLLAPTNLRQTDSLPSVMVVELWQSLPSGPTSPLPSRADLKLQKVMKDAWKTQCGQLVAAVLSTPWAVRLFDGRGAEEEATAAAAAITDGSTTGQAVDFTIMLAAAEVEFNKGSFFFFRNSGLAGPFRHVEKASTWKLYLTSLELVFDISFMLGEVLVQFHRISEGLGDYGMVRSASWLHPILEVLTEKVSQLRTNLSLLMLEVDELLILGPARGISAEGPVPSQQMSKRANEAISKAINGHDSLVEALLHCLDELRTKSAPERMPHVVGSIGDACSQLQAVFSSQTFKSRIGSKAIPPLPATAESPTSHRLAVEAGSPPSSPSLSGIALVQPAKSDTPPMKVLVDNPIFDLVHWFFKEDDGLWAPLSVDDCTMLEEAMSGGGGSNHTVRLGAGQWLYHVNFVTMEQRNPKTGKVRQLRRDGPSRALPEVQKSDSASASTVAPTCSGASCSTSSGDSPVQLQTDVWRLSGVSSFKRHDRRKLQITDGQLEIFEPGSRTVIKTMANIGADVDDCKLVQGDKVLSLFIRRQPKRDRRLVAAKATEDKMYFFEFDNTDMARAFVAEICRFRS